MEKNRTKFDPIPNRINRINEMSENQVIDGMIDKCLLSDESECIDKDDIRELLPKKYIDFNKAINQLGGKLLYIKSGSTGHTFKGVHLDDKSKTNYGVKIVAYPKKENYGDLYNINRPENAELLIINKHPI